MNTSPDPIAPAETPTLRWVLASLSLSMLMPSLDTSIANAGLPTLALALHASFQQVQWVVLAYLLAITTLIVGVGRLGDLLGRRRLLLGGVALFTVASLLCGLAPTLGWLVAARALQGLGAAMMMALAVALVGDAVPKARTGRAMGLLGSMSALGTMAGPSLGGVLMTAFGWPAIFWVNVPLGLLNLWLVARYLPADCAPDGAARPRFDVAGTLLLALTLAAYALAMTLGHGQFGWLNVALLAGAAVGVALFVRVEARAAAPLLRLALFANRVLSASLAMSVLVATVMMATLVVGPFYLARALGLPAVLVGLTLSAGPLVSALTGVPAGRWVDRFGAARISVVGLLAMLGGCTGLALLPASLGVPGYLAPLAVLTLGYALFQAANNTAIMAGAGPQQRGVISGMLSLSRNLGLVTGASVMGAVFAAASSVASAAGDVGSASPQAVAHGMRFTFMVAVGLVLAALALALAIRVHAARGHLA